MDVFVIGGFVFGIMGFVFALSALAKTSKLEKQLKEAGLLEKGFNPNGRNK